MKWNELTNEEKKLLYKCILRQHKENGCLSIFKRNDNFRFNNLVNGANFEEIHESLLSPMWSTYRDYLRESIEKDFPNEEAEVKSSIFYIGLIDLLMDSNNKSLKDIGRDIAYSELDYLDYEFGDLIATGIDYSEETKNDAKKAWEKYKYLTPGKYYNNLPNL